MIGRIWRGRTKKEHAEAYAQVVRDTGLADISREKGNLGAWLLRRVDGDQAEFVLITLWGSLDEVRNYIGSDVDKARYYPEDDPYLIDRDEYSLNYELVDEISRK
jgi:heme-degrading monooxygenase HmoA